MRGRRERILQLYQWSSRATWLTQFWSCLWANVDPQVLSLIVKLLIWWLLIVPFGLGRIVALPIVSKSHLEVGCLGGSKDLPVILLEFRFDSACTWMSSANLPESCGPARKGWCNNVLAEGRSVGSCIQISWSRFYCFIQEPIVL